MIEDSVNWNAAHDPLQLRSNGCPNLTATEAAGAGSSVLTNMLLAIDIGNTNIVWGVFDGAKLLADWRVGTDQSKTTDEYAILLLDLLRVKGISPDRVAGVILSSVVPPLTPLFEELSETYLHCPPLIVSHELESGLTIKSINPREVGSDRIVNAAAAYRRYGGPVILVDFGTATPFRPLTAEAE